ncbi:MAG TPA: nucleotidyltransferase domain-containing protein, partial [Burkholderiaceae bacterium]|nr:nucleotidyltransferase domain-containing protein [Burkholderiaceae bacterium]
MNDLGFSLRSELHAAREALSDAYRQGGSINALLQGLSRATDRFLARIVHDAKLEHSVAVVAVGGYGRGELFPHSDVDILLLTPDGLDTSTSGRIEQLVGVLWDLGLQLGHSVRTIEECREEARRDVTVLTSMLESRRVAGPRALYRDFEHAITDVLDPPAFFRAKLLEQQQRHVKYEESPYSLEPNCKESPGGLRDLQVVLWVAGAAGFGTSWSELARRNLVTRDECRMLIAKERVLKRMRAHLHIAARRREDRLLFDVQQAVAGAMGFAGTASRLAS